MGWPRPVSCSAIRVVDLLVQISGLLGSPPVLSSRISLKAGNSPGSCASTGFRPPPTARTRSPFFNKCFLPPQFPQAAEDSRLRHTSEFRQHFDSTLANCHNFSGYKPPGLSFIEGLKDLQKSGLFLLQTYHLIS